MRGGGGGPRNKFAWGCKSCIMLWCISDVSMQCVCVCVCVGGGGGDVRVA